MSFSSTVKYELCRLDTGNNCCMKAELAAVVNLSHPIKDSNESNVNIKIVTENAAFARRVFSIIRRLYNIYPEVIIRKSRKLKGHVSYILIVTSSMGAGNILKDCSFTEENEFKKFTKKTCCKKAYLRGAFLTSGSLSDPEKTYHLEISGQSVYLAYMINDLVNGFNLNSKIIKRKGYHITYLKEGENIVDFLNIIGAHTALLEMENIRILKGMRNSVNRVVNCETANLEKTVNASVRQIENIKYIKDSVGFEHLPDNLREVAELRLLYNDANLKELGLMLSPPLGKSGVNHRLRKLDTIAESIKITKGDYK